MHLLFDIPVILGPAGVGVVAIIITILAALNGIQWYQKESKKRLEERLKNAEAEIEKWKTVADASKSTVDFAQSELGLNRGRCERLENEVKELLASNVVLRQQTNLEGLQSEITKGRELAIAQVMKRIDEMDKRINEVHVATLAGLREISETLHAQHQEFVAQVESSNGLIQSQAAFIKSLQSQIELHRALDEK